MTQRTAALHFLIEQILVHTDCLHQRRKFYELGHQDLKNAVEDKFSLLKYEGEKGNKLRSINDNEAGYAEMRPYLESQYAELGFSGDIHFHEIAGGLRLNSEDANKELAYFLREMDKLLVQLNAIEPNEFFFVGRKLC